MENVKNKKDIVRKKRFSLFFLLGALYSTFAFFMVLVLRPEPTVSLVSFRLGEISGVLTMLGMYFFIPIALINFIIILVKYRIVSKEDRIIGDIPLTFIVISLMFISFVVGILMSA